MSNSVRAELLAVLTELSEACPEMRFGQLIANLSTLAKGPTPEGLWDAEDEELLDAARKQLTYFQGHRSLSGVSVPFTAGAASEIRAK